MCIESNLFYSRGLWSCAGAVVLALGGFSFAGDAPERIPVELQNVSIAIFGQPYTGSILPGATEEGFRFQPKGSTEQLSFRWSTLEPSERERIRKLVGLDGGDRSSPDSLWGEEIAGFRLTLKTGRVLEGIPQPERDRPGFRAFRTGSKQVMIPEPEIVAEERIVVRESQVFSAEEGYERLLIRRPPKDDSASDHLELARTCVRMGLLERALQHAEQAKAIDPKAEETHQAFFLEIQQKLKTRQATEAYSRIVMAIQAADYGTALARCDDFLGAFLADERYTRVQKMREELEPKRQVHLREQVIRMYYSLVSDLLQQRMGRKIKVDAKGLPVPAIPGKQVTTRNNQVIRGLPVGDDGLKVVLKDVKKDLTIEIPRKDIRAIEDVDLSEGVKRVDPTFEELKAYATGELGTDIVARIAQTLQVPPAQVQELWEGRFERTGRVENGMLRVPPPLTAPQTASYGEGSWLRCAPAGNAGMVLVEPDPADDPELWWSAQSAETKLGILRAFAGESLFKVKSTPGKVCPECSGRGVLEAPASGEPKRCPVCRGLKNLVTMVYE